MCSSDLDLAASIGFKRAKKLLKIMAQARTAALKVGDIQHVINDDE